MLHAHVIILHASLIELHVHIISPAYNGQKIHIYLFIEQGLPNSNDCDHLRTYLL